MTKHLKWLVFLGLFVACDADRADRTQVMVVIDAQPQVRALAEDLDLEVRSGSGAVDGWEVRARRSLTLGDGIEWPLQAALVPQGDDAARVYLVIVRALDAEGDVVSEVRAISGYVRGKTLSLLLLFEDSCIGKSDRCGEEQTCRSGGCVDAHVDPRDLPLYELDDEGKPVLVPFWEDGLDGGSDAGGTGGSGGMSGSGGTSGSAGGDAGPRACDDDDDCDDDDPCNGQETCERNRCVAGSAFECEDTGEFCRANVCVNDDGEPRCELQNVKEAEPCREGDDTAEPRSSCTRDYRCVAGACEPATVERCDESPCESRAGCDPQDGCVFAPKSSDTSCDDGDNCTVDDHCSGRDGRCAGTPKDCSDGVDCTVDSCNAAGECVHTPSDARCSGPCKSGTCHATMDCLNVTFAGDFTDCDDGSGATGPDLCYRGECRGGREGAPSASCAVGGCGCSGFTNVRDLEYVGEQYVGLIEASQTAGDACTAGTVSIVYDVRLDELTPFTTDTPNGGISETSSDISGTYVISANRFGYLNTANDSVQWQNTPLDAALSQIPSLINYRGIARLSTGLIASRTSHVWVWGSQQGTSAALVAHCTWCSGVVIGGCDSTITCSSAGFSNTTVASVAPYVNNSLATLPYGGGIQLMNGGSVSKRIYEDGTGKDFVYNTTEIDDTNGTWSGALRLSGAGQVLAFGSGTVHARLCSDPTYSGNTTCTAVTISSNPRSFTRAALGSGNTSVFLLATNGSSQYLFLLPMGADPADANNWREIVLANSGTTLATAVAAGPDSFMVLGKTGAVPYVWYWGP